MRRPSRILLTMLVFSLVAPASLAQPAPGGEAAAQLRGVLLTAEGLPAVGYQIGLKSTEGDLFLSPPTAKDGGFALELVPPGSYSVVAFGPNGAEYPVLGREIALTAGQVERLELRIAEQGLPPGRTAEEVEALRERTGSGKLAALTGKTKVIVVVAGIAAAAGLAIALSDDDDDDEPPVSPAEPR
jgi:hypothetical protein